ncbi:MotE family protein [Donghicola sp. XS_ASV15]|uniref:MotE family protein n=1 Tax=Donghicola sp. XS_ASV15 TaxID=3241295 RepID=UPI003518A291
MARARRSGSLVAIAALFATGGALKIGMTATEAIALAPALATAEPEETFVDYRDKELTELFEALAKREAFNDARTKELNAKEQEIEAKLEVLESKREEALALISELQEENERLRRTMGLGESASEDDLDQLTKVYEAMKPKEAATLFAEMDMEFAAGFLGRMKAQSAAAIMGNLPSSKAYAVSAILAGRNASWLENNIANPLNQSIEE